jgi:hypothetical protein
MFSCGLWLLRFASSEAISTNKTHFPYELGTYW